MSRRATVPQLLLFGLVGALAVTLLFVGTTSSATLGVYNADWDGTTAVRDAATAAGTPTVARNVSAYRTADPNGTLAVVVSPTESYGPEAAAVRSYVRAGGTLLVAEDYGDGGNELLSAVGADARVDGTPLRDEQRAGPSPAFPEATPTGDHTYTEGVETLLLNHGTVVRPGNATTLVASSSFSYLDRNRNRELDDEEVLAERPVVTAESVGNGTVVVVSDPSVFINSMLDRRDNRAFLDAVVGSHDRVLLDVSHTSGLPPLVALQLTLQRSPATAFVLAVCSILGVAVLATPTGIRARLSGRGASVPETATLSEAELLATIRERHPEWDDERVERVTGSLIQRRRQSGTDD